MVHYDGPAYFKQGEQPISEHKELIPPKNKKSIDQHHKFGQKIPPSTAPKTRLPINYAVIIEQLKKAPEDLFLFDIVASKNIVHHQIDLSQTKRKPLFGHRGRKNR